MSKYVPDVMSRRWVIISSQRLARPDNFDTKKKSVCPFCPGNESISPDEVFRIGQGEKNKPGWKVRVISNKFPITDYHEVILHSPDCEKDIDTFPISQVVHLFNAYKERYNFYRKKGQVLIFCNRGEHAGASIKHPHSQLVVIPNQINLDALSREPLNNIVQENTYFNIYCPDFSQWPYEVWVAPKKEGGVFGDIDAKETEDLAHILQKLLKRLRQLYEHHQLTHMEFGYNYYIYPKENWYIRIIPRFVHRAGFELGTGLSVNIMDPTEAARQLRGEEERVKEVLKKIKSFDGR